MENQGPSQDCLSCMLPLLSARRYFSKGRAGARLNRFLTFFQVRADMVVSMPCQLTCVTFQEEAQS
jgi:hypothetical protein